MSELANGLLFALLIHALVWPLLLAFAFPRQKHARLTLGTIMLVIAGLGVVFAVLAHGPEERPLLFVAALVILLYSLPILLLRRYVPPRRIRLAVLAWFGLLISLVILPLI